MGIIIEAKLVAIRNGYFTLYVFEKLGTKEYIMCTRLPNWQTPDINIGDIGFLQYKEVLAGEKYYNPETQIEEIYKYSNVYFFNFVLKSDFNKNIITF